MPPASMIEKLTAPWPSRYLLVSCGYFVATRRDFPSTFVLPGAVGEILGGDDVVPGVGDGDYEVCATEAQAFDEENPGPIIRVSFEELVEAREADLGGAGFYLAGDVGGALKKYDSAGNSGHAARITPGSDPLNGEAA